MTHYIFLFVWRIIVLLAGIGLAYFAAFRVFPYVDKSAPLWLAIFATYCFLAYIGIPALIRLLRLVIKPNHVPTHVTTGDGWASDPVNIAVAVANKRQFIRVMRRSGWHVADEATLRNLMREGYAILFDKTYLNAPFSSLYLFGRKQDIGFQIAGSKSGSPRHRHHVRFWRMDATGSDEEISHHGFWLRFFRQFMGIDKEIWVGAATYDKHPVGLRWRSGQLTHLIDANTNAEREFIIGTLKEAGLLKQVTDIKAGEPYKFRGQSFGVTIISDGYIKLCELKRPILPKL